MKERELLEQIYALWGNGDYTRTDFLHPEFELSFADGFLDTGVFQGAAEAWRGWRGWLEQWEEWRYEPTQYMPLEDGRVAVLIDMRGVSRTTGVKLEASAANLWEF